MVAKQKIGKCPWHGAECNDRECLAWSPFPAVNPKDGKVAIDNTGNPVIIGEGCTLLGRVLKQTKA